MASRCCAPRAERLTPVRLPCSQWHFLASHEVYYVTLKILVLDILFQHQAPAAGGGPRPAAAAGVARCRGGRGIAGGSPPHLHVVGAGNPIAALGLARLGAEWGGTRGRDRRRRRIRGPSPRPGAGAYNTAPTPPSRGVYGSAGPRGSPRTGRWTSASRRSAVEEQLCIGQRPAGDDTAAEEPYRRHQHAPRAVLRGHADRPPGGPPRQPMANPSSPPGSLPA